MVCWKKKRRNIEENKAVSSSQQKIRYYINTVEKEKFFTMGTDSQYGMSLSEPPATLAQFFLFSPSTWPWTETGVCADLLSCTSLTDRLIVDKQLDSMPEPPRPSPLRRLSLPRSRCDLLALPRMTTMLHPSLSLRHKRVLCGAGCRCLLVSLCHHYCVTGTKTGAGDGGGRAGTV